MENMFIIKIKKLVQELADPRLTALRRNQLSIGRLSFVMLLCHYLCQKNEVTKLASELKWAFKYNVMRLISDNSYRSIRKCVISGFLFFARMAPTL